MRVLGECVGDLPRSRKVITSWEMEVAGGVSGHVIVVTTMVTRARERWSWEHLPCGEPRSAVVESEVLLGLAGTPQELPLVSVLITRPRFVRPLQARNMMSVFIGVIDTWSPGI